jgi:hypothetical protein
MLGVMFWVLIAYGFEILAAALPFLAVAAMIAVAIKLLSRN